MRPGVGARDSRKKIKRDVTKSWKEREMKEEGDEDGLAWLGTVPGAMAVGLVRSYPAKNGYPHHPWDSV